MELPWEWPERPEKWAPVSRLALICWLVFFGFIILVPSEKTPIGNILYGKNLAVFPHEGGHIVFGELVQSDLLCAMGRGVRSIVRIVWRRAELINDDVVVAFAGALGQCSAALWPLLYFLWRRHTMAVAFCTFWFFTNFVDIGVYMLDSRLMLFNYIGPGMYSPGWNPAEGHDWMVIFTTMNIPFARGEHMGREVYYAGYVGMIFAAGWLVFMHLRMNDSPLLAAFKGGDGEKVPDIVELAQPGSGWDVRVTTAHRKPEWQSMVQVEYEGAYYHVAEGGQELIGGKSMYRYYLKKAAETEALRGVIHYDPFSG